MKMARYVGGAVGGLATYVAANYLFEQRTSKPLDIEVLKQPSMKVMGVNILPLVGAVFRSLPDSTRRNIGDKENAPKSIEIEDWFDVFGTDPYTIKEVVPGKVWSVQFKFVHQNAFNPKSEAGMKMLGFDYESEEGRKGILDIAQKWKGDELVEQTKKDIEEQIRIKELIKEKGKCNETISACGPQIAYMAVVKLNNGEVMLYSPVKVRTDTGFSDWLESIGPVKWVVMGSSSHTLQIPGVMNSFPEASYVSCRSAWNKLRLTKDWKLIKDNPDYDYSNPEELKNLNTLLADEGVKMYHINGDTLTEALVVSAHDTALECDLLYSRMNGAFMNSEDETPTLRLFNLLLCKKPNSPNNALPPYRFWFMDPTNDLSAMGSVRPAKDGSSSTNMAQSLREMLKADFKHAIGVHAGVVPGEEFKECIDLNWGWLDQQSLLKPNKQ